MKQRPNVAICLTVAGVPMAVSAALLRLWWVLGALLNLLLYLGVAHGFGIWSLRSAGWARARSEFRTGQPRIGLRDVQDFARHEDPKTTRRYDRARNQLNRHATYAIAQYLAGGS